MRKSASRFCSLLSDVRTLDVITLSTLAKLGIILAILLAEAFIIFALFSTLLPRMEDGVAKLVLMVGLPTAVMVGDIFLFTRLFKSGNSNNSDDFE